MVQTGNHPENRQDSWQFKLVQTRNQPILLFIYFVIYDQKHVTFCEQVW